MTADSKLHTSFLLTAVLGLLALNAWAEDDCRAQAEGVYEQAYCEILTRGKGAGLPRFDDFRQSEAQVQYLLLKRPARSAGVNLPKPSTKARKSPSKARTPPPPRRSVTTAAESKPTPPRQAQSVTTATAPSLDCSHQQTLMICSGQRYSLAQDLTNSQLRLGALEAGNTLDMPEYSGKADDDDAINRYLSSIYPIYLEKMLDIGLGGATMSYSRFHHLHEEIRRQNENFSQRFATMFEFLKKDKASIAVLNKARDLSLVNMEMCTQLRPKLIACDAGSENFLFVRK